MHFRKNYFALAVQLLLFSLQVGFAWSSTGLVQFMCKRHQPTEPSYCFRSSFHSHALRTIYFASDIFINQVLFLGKPFVRVKLSDGGKTRVITKVCEIKVDGKPVASLEQLKMRLALWAYWPHIGFFPAVIASISGKGYLIAFIRCLFLCHVVVKRRCCIYWTSPFKS